MNKEKGENGDPSINVFSPLDDEARKIYLISMKNILCWQRLGTAPEKSLIRLKRKQDKLRVVQGSCTSRKRENLFIHCVTKWKHDNQDANTSSIPLWYMSHYLRQSDGGTLVVIKAIHHLQAGYHVYTIGEYENHEECSEQPRKDAGRESRTVASIEALFTSHIEGLDLEVMKSHLPE